MDAVADTGACHEEPAAGAAAAAAGVAAVAAQSRGHMQVRSQEEEMSWTQQCLAPAPLCCAELQAAAVVVVENCA